MKKTVGLPSGIGDCAWALFKLVHVKNEIDVIEIADGWPYRTREFVELCGFEAKYAPFNYADILMSQHVNKWETWGQVREARCKGVLIAPNQHLEQGRRIEEWLPDLPTNFNLRLHTTEAHKQRAQELLREVRQQCGDLPLLGVSCASYRGSDAWKTWRAEQWIDCLKRVMRLDIQPVLIGGYWDDCTADVADALGLPNLVGKTNIGVAVEIQKELDAYFGYSSGLGVIRVMQDLPCMMLWPDHEPDQRPLSTSWVPQEMLWSKRYVARPWRPVEEIIGVVGRFLSLCLEEREARRAIPHGEDPNGGAVDRDAPLGSPSLVED